MYRPQHFPKACNKRFALFRDSTSLLQFSEKKSMALPAPIICPFLHWVIYPLASGGLQLTVLKTWELLHDACVLSTGGIEKAQEGDQICK